MNRIPTVRRLVTIAVLFSFQAFGPDWSEAQSFRNLRVEQSDDTVRITYDVYPNLPDETYKVTVYLSTNGGTSFRASPLRVSGDAGNGVRPGPNKLIRYFPLENDTDLKGSSIVFRLRGKVLGTSPVVEFAPVSGGAYLMGDPFDEGELDEFPVHEVHVDSFEICQYEVTNLQYAAFLREYGSSCVKSGGFRGEQMIYEHSAGLERAGPDDGSWRVRKGYEFHPVVNVTWYGAYEFCRFHGWRLPTEAEWEYAAREEGKRVRFGNGSVSLTVGGANIAGAPNELSYRSTIYDSAGSTVRVASYLPNALELFDMSGNVWEWCQDWYAPDYYLHSKQDDPAGPWLGRYKSIRGGSWFTSAGGARNSGRSFFSPHGTNGDLGFRAVRTVSGQRGE